MCVLQHLRVAGNTYIQKEKNAPKCFRIYLYCMQFRNTNKTELVQKLNEILELSLPRCSDNNIYEDIFIAINKRAYECLKEAERLVIQKIE